MAEYIDKQAAIEAVNSVPAADWVSKRYAGALKRIPPANVRPVVRGQWKFAINPMLHDGPGPSCWCSECKKPPIDKKNVWYHLDGTFAREGEEFVLSDFCPNCGADMRGGDNDGRIHY